MGGGGTRHGWGWGAEAVAAPVKEKGSRGGNSHMEGHCTQGKNGGKGPPTLGGRTLE